MFNKIKLGLFLFLSAFSIAQGQSCFCDPTKDHRGGIWYTVNAPSGLILRAAPNRNAAKLDAIPFGEEVFACSITQFSETIEGNRGDWIKVTWAHKTGYVFGGFLQQTNTRKIQMVIPNAGVNSDWGCMELSPEVKWEALVKDTTNNGRRKQSPRYSSVALKLGKKKADPECLPNGEVENGILNLTDPAFAVFSGFKLGNQIYNAVEKPIKLMPGEVVHLSTYDRINKIKRMYLITVEGNALPNNHFMKGDPYFGPIRCIENYKISLFEQSQKFDGNGELSPWSVQKLMERTVTQPSDTGTYEMDVYFIYFAGDLDGDHQLDLILATMRGVGTFYELHLSSKKLPGFLLRYVASWSDSSC